MKTRIVLLVAAAIAVLAGPAAGALRRSPTVTVRHTSFGQILVDGRGFALYAFSRDTRGHSTCSGRCASRWPPYVVHGALTAGTGTKQSLLASTRRRDGRVQATYAGRPLYYYVGDRSPGQVLCQNVAEFGGTWLVMRGSGRLVR